MKRYTILLILSVITLSLLVMFIAGCSDTPTENDVTGGLNMNITVNSSSELIQQVSQYELEARGSFGTLTTALHIQDGMLVGEMEVPAGEVHFTARAYNEQGVLLYQGETDVTVVPDKVTPINISLSPVVSMIKLSPRYTTVQRYSSLAVTVKIFNIPNLNQVSFRLYHNWDLMAPDSVIKNPDLGPDVIMYDTVLYTTAGWAMSFLNSSEIDTLVNSSGDVTLATAYYNVTPPVFAAQFRNDTTAITIGNLTMYDFEGMEITPKMVYYDSSVVIIVPDTTPNIPPHDAIVPLTTGNFWTYATYDTSGVTNVFRTLEITGVDTITLQNQEHEVYRWNWLDEEGQPNSTYGLVKNTDSGMVFMGTVVNGETDTTSNGLIFKYPASVGDKWSYHDKLGAWAMECVDTNQVIETPAGNIACYVYKSVISQGLKSYHPFDNIFNASISSGLQSTAVNQSEIYLYCAPGVGYVGMGATPDASHMTGGLLLYKYSVE